MSYKPRPVSGALGSGLAALALLVDGFSTTAAAQDASPTATPTAVACNVERRDVDELIDLLRSAPPAAQPSEIERLPARQLADAATVAEIERTVRLFEACMNTGDQLLLSSFFSDRMLSLPVGDELAASIETELRAIAAATPTPLPEEGRASIIGPWNVQELADGRVLAGVNILGNDEDALDPFIVTALVFVREDGRWLLDEPLEEFIHVGECDLNVPAGYVLGLPPGYEAAAYYGEADGPHCLPLDPDRDRDRDREDRPERRGERAATTGGTPTAAP